MANTCWASVLGGCAGGITSEHVVSKSLLGDSVSVRGLPWCPEFKTIGAAGLTVKGLCKAHNNALSPCDQEARRLGDLVNWMMSDFLPPDGPDRVEELNGHLLTRWLCKTACNIAAVGGRAPPMPFVRYAFSSADDPSVHVYAVNQVGDRVRLETARHTIEWLAHKSDPERAFVVFWFRGLSWIIGTHPIEAAVVHIDDLIRSSGVVATHYVGRVKEMGVNKIVPGLGVCLSGRVVVRW